MAVVLEWLKIERNVEGHSYEISLSRNMIEKKAYAVQGKILVTELGLILPICITSLRSTNSPSRGYSEESETCSVIT